MWTCRCPKDTLCKSFLGQSQWEFYREFHSIKYHQFCWHGKKRRLEFYGMWEEFHHHKAIPSGKFHGVSFSLNSMPHMIFWWHGIKFKKRERKLVSSRWNHVYTHTNSCWVIKLNTTWSLWNHAMKLCIVELVSNTISFLSCLCGYFGNINMKHSTGISLSESWWLTNDQ